MKQLNKNLDWILIILIKFKNIKAFLIKFRIFTYSNQDLDLNVEYFLIMFNIFFIYKTM
jgi:hypothetical protein